MGSIPAGSTKTTPRLVRGVVLVFHQGRTCRAGKSKSETKGARRFAPTQSARAACREVFPPTKKTPHTPALCGVLFWYFTRGELAARKKASPKTKGARRFAPTQSARAACREVFPPTKKNSPHPRLARGVVLVLHQGRTCRAGKSKSETKGARWFAPTQSARAACRNASPSPLTYTSSASYDGLCSVL